MRTLTVASMTLVAAACGGMQPERTAPTDATLAQNLTFVREEEKLAHDVYVALGERWGLPIFDNIQASEARHTEAVRGLLVSYGIPDPAEGRGPGDFADPVLAQLYTTLLAEGQVSIEAALDVGARIEDLDLVDLETRGAGAPADVATVFANLSRGSRNHLRSFTGQLAARGVTFTPEYLDEAAYQAIVSTDIERGGP